MAENKSCSSPEDFDYMRFTWSDIHGIAKGKVVTKKNISRVWKDGIRISSGVNGFGPSGQIVFQAEPLKKGYCNDVIKVVPSTLFPVPWASTQDFKVGQVLMEWKWSSGEAHDVCPRTMLTRLMDTLYKDFGYQVMCGIEYEFILLHIDSLKPVFQPPESLGLLTFSNFEKFFLTMDQQLQKAGIDVECYHPEFADGQFEMATEPKYGIEAIDQAFKLKESVKEVSRKSGYVGTFMSRPFLTGLGNAGQLNMSLWSEDKQNAFYDAEKAGCMSNTFKHWVAGLIKHTPALSAICNPTVNCYRRLHQAFVHKNIDWGLDNRAATYSAKAYSPARSFLENRMPTAAANPYLVCAAMLAAGMDGLRNKLQLPVACDPDADKVPQTLEDALVALEQDEVIMEALGQRFIEWFLLEKREVEINAFKDHKMDSDSEAELEAEREMYLISI